MLFLSQWQKCILCACKLWAVIKYNKEQESLKKGKEATIVKTCHWFQQQYYLRNQVIAKEAYPCFIDSNRNCKSLVNLILTHDLSRMYWDFFFSGVTGPILLCTLVPLYLPSYFTSSQNKGHPTHKIQWVKSESKHKIHHKQKVLKKYISNSFATRLPILLPITGRLKIRKKWNKAEINLRYIQYE